MFVFFAAALAVQFIYWIIVSVGLGRIPDAEPPEHSDLPVSVIVAARNEEAILPRLLNALSWQSHDNFEVIIVNDGSTDNTAEIVRHYAKRDSRFTLLTVEHPQDPRKKNALTVGIAAASNERLLFTDAACVPHRDWVMTFANEATKHPNAVLIGYGPY